MADIHQVITLGIGTPADIPHFMLFGLSTNPSAANTILADVVVACRADDYVLDASSLDYVIAAPADDEVGNP